MENKQVKLLLRGTTSSGHKSSDKNDGDRNDVHTWSEEESQKLLNLVRDHGTAWKKLTEMLPERTEASMRNRYLRMMNNFKKHDGFYARNRARNRKHEQKTKPKPKGEEGEKNAEGTDADEYPPIFLGNFSVDDFDDFDDFELAVPTVPSTPTHFSVMEIDPMETDTMEIDMFSLLGNVAMLN